jgi:Protein of unknown function (DUF975)/GYF domain 2
MATYTIIGGDQKEYGPITAEDIGLWIGEGRLNEHSLIKGEGDAEFRPLGNLPEFAGAFAAKPQMSGTPPAFARSTGSANWDQRDYDLDIGGCISRGWNLVKENFGLLFVAALIFALIEGFIAALGSIPIIGPIFSIVNLVIAGPLMGGLYYVFIQTVRNQPATVGDVFAGFRKSFGQLFLGHIVPALLMGLCFLPFLIVLIIELLPLVGHMQNGQSADPQAIANALSKTSLLLIFASFLVCLIPTIYFQICWWFTLPLIIDKEMDFWTAMGTSRKMVRKHWWLVFGLTILIGLINVAGLCACCIGALFTAPICFAAMMFAYETIFSEGPAA